MIDDGTLRTLAAGHVPHDGRGLCAALAAEVLRLRAENATLAERADDAERAERRLSRDAWQGDAARLDAERLQDILTPRTTPPTPAEMAAHGAAGGVWLTAWPWRSGIYADLVVPALRARDAVEPGMTWLPLNAQRRPCAWPTPARLPGCETVGPCGYCDHPERPR